jgi:hypothetical protein
VQLFKCLPLCVRLFFDIVPHPLCVQLCVCVRRDALLHTQAVAAGGTLHTATFVPREADVVVTEVWWESANSKASTLNVVVDNVQTGGSAQCHSYAQDAARYVRVAWRRHESIKNARTQYFQRCLLCLGFRPIVSQLEGIELLRSDRVCVPHYVPRVQPSSTARGCSLTV